MCQDRNVAERRMLLWCSDAMLVLLYILARQFRFRMGVQEELSAGRAVVLDGGTGEELVRRGADTSKGAWSAQALLDQPSLVRDVHSAFLEAGASVIIANSYATTSRRFPERSQFLEVNDAAGRLAMEARGDRDALILASLPPLFGSYQPENVRKESQLVPEYRAQAEALKQHVDVFLCETMSTASEARAAVRGALEAGGRPVWVSWTLSDDARFYGRLRSGETVREAAATLDGLEVAALLVNCSLPESVTAAMSELAQVAGGRPFGGYANAFVPIAGGVNDGRDLPAARQDLGPAAYAEFAERWLDMGAQLVGGCCEVGPEYIAEVCKRFRAKGRIAKRHV